MKKTLKNKLILLLISLLTLFLLAGCSLGESFEEILATRNLTARITYYANKGEFESGEPTKEMYYSAGSKPLNIGITNPVSGSAGVSRNNYKFMGWYLVTEVLDEETGECELGEPFDFTKPLQENDHYKIAAKWQALVGAKIVMVCDDGGEVPVGKIVNNEATVTENAQSFKNGDVIGEINYHDDVIVSTTPDKRLFTVADGANGEAAYTFYGFFTDAECTAPVVWPLKRQEQQTTLYAKYIEGEWTFVKSALDVSKMFSGLSNGKNYWLINDIDCSGTSVNALFKVTGKLQGNGYTLQNLTVKKSLNEGDDAAMFGDIQDGAMLSNVSFTGLNISYTYMRKAFDAKIFFAFLSLSENASVSNVKLQGSLKISGPNGFTVTNMGGGDGSLVYTNCLYGAYPTDEAYITASGGNGFTVEGDPQTFVEIE